MEFITSSFHHSSPFYVLGFRFVIQCVCLNPVYQKTLTIEDFRLNSVNRARPEILESPAGKGVNVARVLKTLGQQPLIIGFAGGETGKSIETFLSQEGIAYDFVHTANKTRTCTTILDPIKHTQTELVEEGKPVTSEEVQNIYHTYMRNLDGCRMVTISGTAPQQVPPDIYYHFVRSAQKHHIPVLVDTQKQLLLQCLTATPLLVKINRDELGIAFQQTLDSPETFANLIQNIHEHGVEWVVITHGKDHVTVSHQGNRWTLIPPAIEVLNPIGSGDAFLAGIASAIMEGLDMLQAICFGTACGTANALTRTPGVVQIDDVKRLKQDVTVMEDT